MSSIRDRKGCQVMLTQQGEALSKVIADGLAELYPKESQRLIHHGFKLAAILSLKTSGGWTFEQIGRLFHHPKGHVQRIFVTAVKACRQHFTLNPLLREDPETTQLIEEELGHDEQELNFRFCALPISQKIQALSSLNSNTSPSSRQ